MVNDVAWLLLGVSSLVSVAEPVRTAGRVAEPVRTTITDLAGRPVEVDVTVGDLTIEAWSQPGLQVEIVAGGQRAAALDAGVEDSADRVRIRAVQADAGKDAEVRARVTVRVPVGATVRRAAVFEGQLQVRGLRGQVQASIERGPLTARGLAGTVRLETRSGDLTLSEAELSPGGLLRLRTFNGSITLSLVAAPANARILALTLNGSIRSTLPLSERAGFGPRFREGIFGSGEPLISLDAVRGDLVISAPQR